MALEHADNSSSDEIQREKLCSRNSREHAFAAFINLTSKDVALEWLDFDGNHVSYNARLGPRKLMRMNTFVGHPWIFYEADSRHRLTTLPDRKHIHMPHGYEGGRPSYREVFIVSPFSSLHQLCLKFLHMYLVKSSQQRPESFHEILEKLKDNTVMHKHHCEQLRLLERYRLNKNMPIYINSSTSED